MTTLDNLRKSAKRWLKAIREREPSARARYAAAYPNGPAEPTLRDVQHALARERGQESWIALTQSIERAGASLSPLTTLLQAAGRGDATAVAATLDAEPRLVNERGALGESGLRTALHFGVHHIDVVRLLLSRGADPNIRDEGDHAFPIHFAAERGELDVVKLLVEHGADVDGAGTTHELNVVGWAVCFDYVNHLDVARYLLAHGATHDPFTATALGDAGALRALLAGGADVNRRMDRTNFHRTALHLAVLKDQPGAVSALLDAGADPNVEDAAGLTPLDQAALDERAAIVQTLLDRGADVRLPAAIALGRAADVERLLETDPALSSDESNRRWARLIVRAAGRASREVVDALLRTAERHRAGLSIVNLADDTETAVDGARGYTPLHAAAFAGNEGAIGVLLAHGANPRARDRKYCGTPAGWARYAGHLATANRILAAEIDIFDAVEFDRADRVEAILDRDPGALDRPFKAYADCPSREGQWWPAPDVTPLEWAASQKKENAARVLRDRGASRTPEQVAHAERITRFLQFACWDHHIHGTGENRMYDRAAQRLLAQHPEIATDNLYCAIVCGELDTVQRFLAARPESAREAGGPRGWTPILYSAYTRFTHPRTLENALAIARVLLDHGANPNDFYMAEDARYTALTGVAGEGEQDSPPQPYAPALFELLLERGADPFDTQVLYNTHFHGHLLWWLELVYEHSSARRADAWRDPEWKMLDMGGYGSGARFVLEIAIRHRGVRLAEWALERGANPNAAPARDRRWPKRSLYEVAVLSDAPEIAALLVRHGGTISTPALDEQERFVRACFDLDRAAAAPLLRTHPEWRESPRAMLEAARRNRPDVVELLLDLGFGVNVLDTTGKSPLHEAAGANAVDAARTLIERGADLEVRDRAYGGTPMGWASHGDHREVLDLLSRYSRDIWVLCFRGYVDRVRSLLNEEPALAKATREDGTTLLWWLPDDEDAALAIVNLLLAHGADPRARNTSGRTAADAADTRAMPRVASRLRAAIPQ